MKIRHRYLLIMATTWGPCLALSACAYTLVLHPKYQYKRELRRDVAHAKEEYSRAFEATKGKSRARLAEEVERLQSRTSDFVVDIERAPDLAFEISELANAMHLDSFGMRPAGKRGLNAIADCGRIGEKRIDVSFNTRFPQFAAFLNALERHRPALFVDSFTINRPLEVSSEPQIDMQMAVLVEMPRGD